MNFLSWKEVQTNFWNNTISKTKVTLTLTTTDGDIVSALTMLPMDGKTFNVSFFLILEVIYITKQLNLWLF